MEKLLLVGAGGFGRVVLEHASHAYECAFIDDADIVEVDNTAVIGKINEIDSLFGVYRQLIVTVGNNTFREQIYKSATTIGYHFPNIIASTAYISPHAKLGKGCVILNNAVIQNNARIGDGVILNPGVEIHHDSVVGNFVLIYTNSVVRSLARVGDRANIGSTLTIGNGVVVKADSRIEDGVSIKR